MIALCIRVYVYTRVYVYPEKCMYILAIPYVHIRCSFPQLKFSN